MFRCQSNKNVQDLYGENNIIVMKEIEKDLNKFRDILFSQFGRVNIVNVLGLPKWIHRFNTISIKSPANTVCRYRHIILKCIWKGKRTRPAKTILKKQKGIKW